MSDIIVTVKNSKVLVVLLILYTVIAIGVVVLDQTASSKKKGDTPKNSVLTEDNIKKFSSALMDLYEDIDDYVTENEIKAGTCVPLTDLYPDDKDIQGSFLVTNSLETYDVWYTKYGLYVNGIPLTDYSVDKDDFETSFSSAHFYDCGSEE